MGKASIFQRFSVFSHGIWYTAHFTEQEYDCFMVSLWNEQNGTCAKHLHCLP